MTRVQVFLVLGLSEGIPEYSKAGDADTRAEAETRALAARGVDMPAIYVVPAARFVPDASERGEAVAAAREAAAIAELGLEAVKGNLSDDEVRRRKGLPEKPAPVLDEPLEALEEVGTQEDPRRAPADTKGG